MRTRTFVCITALFLCHPQVWSQAVSKQFPPSAIDQSMAQERKPQAEERKTSADEQGSTDADLPDAPSVIALPVAEPEPAPLVGTDVGIEANEQRKVGDVWTLEGEVVIHYKNYVIRADKVTYDQSQDEIEAEGHLQLEGGPDDEVITASRGTIHLANESGRFYNVQGTIGLRRTGRNNVIYSTPNPFIFTGRVVIKAGPEHYQVVDGTMTSCRLPKPDWRLLARSIVVNNGQARAANTRFELLKLPVFYLPFVTHPVDTESRQSGLLIPSPGNSSTKGFIIGEEVYWAINRSTDLTVGAEYYSKRGWAPMGRFRYHGMGANFFDVRWTSLLDRGLGPNHIDQGGIDLNVDGRRNWSEFTRSVSSVEYLSSYIYRQAFTENFNLAVNSQVKSEAFLTHNRNGFSSEIYFDRYQSFENNTSPIQEVRILHLPSLNFQGVDHPLGNIPLYWGFSSSLAGLSRSEPGFQTSHEVGRFDLYPHLTLPFVAGGWTLRPTVGVRNTFYSKSQFPGTSTPRERAATLDRSDFEASMEIRPPALERDFQLSGLHRELRHVIEPEVDYAFVGGVKDFASTLRFDTTDILSDTNEITYSLTQRFFLRKPGSKACADGDPDPACTGKSKEWVTWQVAQKYFFDTNFGGALNAGHRNVLATTLDFSGVSFLVNSRDVSPVISRLRIHATDNVNLEWDLDYDTRAGRIGASNLFADYRHGNFFGGLTYASLATPEESGGTSASLAKFSQIRPFVAWGNPNRRGFNLAANSGYDFTQNSLQYGGVQAAYNWDCCGFNIEYRRFALGSTRNENQYRFNFSLAGVGTAGNLRRSERLF